MNVNCLQPSRGASLTLAAVALTVTSGGAAAVAGLARHMRAAWASFAARGNPSTARVSWPSVGKPGRMLSLVPPQPHIASTYAADHHCGFWAAG